MDEYSRRDGEAEEEIRRAMARAATDEDDSMEALFGCVVGDGVRSGKLVRGL